MHSRIMQVSKEQIETYEYIKESDYYDHWFINSIADYVSDNCDRDEDIEWLQKCAQGFEFNEDEKGKYFIVKSKEEYFARDFGRFEVALDKIKKCTLEDFANGISEMWDIKNSYEDKFGFYVDSNDNDLEPLDSFVRHCDVGVKYYIGGTVDYHF